MTQEEKAKAYDNVRQKILLRFGSNVVEEIFSEYEDSEDEKIRKAIKLMYSFLPNKPKYIGGVSVEDVFAWLEKQDEKHDIEVKQMFIKALERVEELNAKGYKLTDCDKNSWWKDFKACSEQIFTNSKTE